MCSPGFVFSIRPYQVRMAPRSVQIRKHFWHVAGSCDTSPRAAAIVCPTISRAALEGLGRRPAAEFPIRICARLAGIAARTRLIRRLSRISGNYLAPSEGVRQIAPSGFNHKKHAGTCLRMRRSTAMVLDQKLKTVARRTERNESLAHGGISSRYIRPGTASRPTAGWSCPLSQTDASNAARKQE